MARPMPDDAAQAVITSVRRCGSGKVAPRMARLLGRISAPPRPATSCAAITVAVVPAVAASSPPAITITTPTQNIRLRPRRLPSVPADSTRPATTSVYALGIQISALGLRRRSAWMADSAEIVAVMSRNVIITPRHIAAGVRSSLRRTEIRLPFPA